MIQGSNTGRRLGHKGRIDESALVPRRDVSLQVPAGRLKPNRTNKNHDIEIQWPPFGCFLSRPRESHTNVDLQS